MGKTRLGYFYCREFLLPAVHPHTQTFFETRRNIISTSLRLLSFLYCFDTPQKNITNNPTEVSGTCANSCVGVVLDLSR